MVIIKLPEPINIHSRAGPNADIIKRNRKKKKPSPSRTLAFKDIRVFEVLVFWDLVTRPSCQSDPILSSWLGHKTRIKKSIQSALGLRESNCSDKDQLISLGKLTKNLYFGGNPKKNVKNWDKFVRAGRFFLRTIYFSLSLSLSL